MPIAVRDIIYEFAKDMKKLHLIIIFVLLSFLNGCGNVMEREEVTVSTLPSEAVKETINSNNENDLSVMSYVLLDGIKNGEFTIYLGQGGGIPLLNNDEEEVGVVEIHRSTESYFEDGKLVRISNPNNHSGFDSAWEELDTEVRGIFAEYSRDFGEHQTLWYAFWSEEDMKPIYAIALYKEYWTKEQALELFNSVSFSDDAFTEISSDSQRFYYFDFTK